MPTDTFGKISAARGFRLWLGTLLRCLLVSWSLTACDKLGIRAIGTVDEQPFRGLSAISLGADGKYLLSWQLPAGNQEELNALSYEIFMDKWSSLPTDLPTVASGQVEAELGTSLGSRLATMPDAEAPVGRGTLLASVRGSRTYGLDITLLPNTFYAFQVRLVDATGKRDRNQQVLIYSSDLNPLSFQGVSGLSMSPSGKLMLEWEPISTLPAGMSSADVSYEVYLSETPQSLEAIISGALIIDGALAMAPSRQQIGTLVELDEAKLPSQTEPILATRKGGRSYEITQKLDPDMSYLFQVVARGPGQELGMSRRVIVYRDASDRTPPVFAGLVSAEANGDKKILLKWNASPSSDTAAYNIYYSYNTNLPIGSTSQTSFLMGGLTPAMSYSFIVRARDNAGNEEKNTIQQSAVTLSYAVPDFAGITSVTPVGGVAGLSTLRLSWPMAGGNVTGYRVYMASSAGAQDFASPAAVSGAVLVNPSIGPYLDGQTTTTTTISGLLQGTPYFFVVRAFYQESPFKPLYSELNTIERSGATNTIKAPTFAGIAAAAAASGSQGLTAVNVGWPAPGVDGVYDGFTVAYEAGSCAAGFSSSPSLLTISDANARSAQVFDLSQQTSYRFRVRTQYAPGNVADSNSACREANTTPTAPVFSGVSSVSTAAGVLGFSTLNVSWPQAQGSFSNYLLEWSASSSFATILGSQTMGLISTTASSISGLPTASLVYVRVKALFSESGFNLESGGQVSLAASPSPMAPSGEGLSTIAIASGSQLDLTWTPPTNAGSVYSGFKLWRSCGSSAASGIISALSGAPYRIFPSAATLAFQDIGLTSNVQCCYQVRAYYSDGTYSLASSSVTQAQCQTPVVIAPSFAGISGLSAPATSLGFNQLSASWSAISSNDAGNFSCYQVSVSTSSASTNWPASCDAVNASLRSASASSYSLTGLSANTNYFVRVRVVNANGTSPVSNGDNTSLSAATTPASPTGDVLNSAVSSGVSSVTVSYTPPSVMPEVGGLYNNVFLLVYQGNADSLSTYKQTALSSGNISSPSFAGVMSTGTITLSSVPTSGALIRVPASALSVGANSFKVDGLNTGTQLCVTALAVYWTSGTTASQFLQSSQNTSKCATPTAIAPAFAGVNAVTAPASVQGFTQLNLSWTAIANADLENFSYYQIQWATSASPSSWNSTTIATAASTSASLTGLTANTTYYVSVAAVNAQGSSGIVANGDAVVVQALTTPKAPTNDNLSAAVSAGAASIQLSYTAPSATASTGGLYNTIFLWVYQTSQTSVVNGFQTAMGVPVLGNITATLSGGSATLSSAPTAGALIQVPTGSFTAGANNTFTITGLTTNQSVCVRAAAVYWVNGDSAKYLLSETPSTRCATPTSVAPSFAGVTSLTGFGDTRDFSGMQVNWGNITGDCTSVDISVSGTSGLANFGGALSVSGLSCALRTSNLSGLTAGQRYYIQVRANNSACGVTPSCSNGSGIELDRVTVPASPSGDSTSSLVFTTLAKAPDSATLTYAVPTSGTWNQISIFRASGISEEAATTAVRAAAATLADYSGPSSAPLAEVTNQALTSYTDSTPLEGVIYCYLAKGVYKSTGRYSASTNTTVQCGTSSFAGISFAGLDASTGAALSSNCPTSYSSYQDETVMVQLTFPSAPGAGVEEYWVYYSNTSSISAFDLSAAPYQIVDNTATSIFNPTLSSASIYVGCQGRTFSGPAYFLVRAIHYGAATPDSNTAISNGIDIPASRSNFVYVSPTVSRLSYPYWIGIGESYIDSASTNGLNSVPSTETALATCNYQFHANKAPSHSSCGTSGSVNRAEMRHGSGSGVTPASRSWSAGWLACRNASEVGSIGSTGATSSAGNYYSRLPTEEEWRRASRPAANSYGALTGLYAGGGGGCQITTGTNVKAMDRPNCVSAVGARNMVGNSNEWVDQRLIGYDISAASESRFSYGPAIGRVLANGIDIQASGVNVPVTPRYHNITPGSAILGLIMGSDNLNGGSTTFSGTATSGSNVVTAVNPTVQTMTGIMVSAGTTFPYGTMITGNNYNVSMTLSAPAASTGAVTVKLGYEKQYEAETARWQDIGFTNAANGFRCVAWPTGKLMPTMAQLAQTSEPVYNANDDLPGGASPTASDVANWKIPENLYVKDKKPETVRHLLKHFPNTTGLAVWPFNQTTSGNQADISGNGKTLTIPTAVPLMSGTGLDGKTYFNWINGAGGNTLNASVDLFTNSFTMGGWFYRSNWGAALNQGGMFGQLTADGYRLSLHNGALCFTTTSHACLYGSADVTSIRPGWHHIVAVRGSATDHRIYVDGTLSWSNASTWNIVSNGSFNVGHFSSTATGAANIFFHAGIGYTTAQVQRLYQATTSFDNAYANADNLSGNDAIKLSWKPWSKKVCTTSCADSVDTGFTYYIYRAIEPTKVDLRHSIPWALKTSSGAYSTLPPGLTGANATAMPLDPLATDASGNLLCSNSFADTPNCVQVATITGSACNSSATTGCSFIDSAALNNGFSSTMLYNYIMVVRDAEGNFRTPKVQRYRSPYFAGDPSHYASATFRTEQRWRRASLMLVDEIYQSAQTIPQVMSYVPMDVSGLDHDFFIHKYEAASAGGAVANNSPSGASDWPLQSNAGNWVNTAAACYDKFSRDSSFPAECGSGGAVNATTTQVKSGTGFAPLVSIDQGAMWKACRNTGVVDGIGNTYYLGLPTDAQWLKAADWGDVNQDGTIDQSFNSAALITTLEAGTADTTSVRCHADNSPGSAYTAGSTQTANCRSRYGAADMVGNIWEWTSGQLLNAVGYDNGVDGLWLGQTFLFGVNGASFGNKYDLLRGFAKSSNAPTVANNGDFQWYASGLRGSFRGGAWGSGTAAGRWSLDVFNAPSNSNTGVGARCSR